MLTCWVPVSLRSLSREEHGFQKKKKKLIELHRLAHGIEEKDQDGKKAKVKTANYNCLGIK